MPDSDYSFSQRLLHQVVLNDTVSMSLFQMGVAIDRDRLEKWKPESTLYVSGLARSGTTALMRAIYSSGKYASLTYADMPFVTAPNLWARITNGKVSAGKLRERAHGDGVLVNYESPESFEEVFWRSIGKIYDMRYIQRDALVAHDVSDELCRDYHFLQRMTCRRYGKRHYLAKNNNHILRLPSLVKCMHPDVKVLLMVRDPMRHAMSLLEQHQRFSNISNWDAKYMRWLGHYEFGDNHRPFSFNKSDKPLPGSPDDLDYWLALWVRVYRYLLEMLESNSKCAANVYPVIYEKMCTDENYCNKIYQLCMVHPDAVRWRFEMRQGAFSYDDSAVEPSVLADARTIYAEFYALANATVEFNIKI